MTDAETEARYQKGVDVFWRHINRADVRVAMNLFPPDELNDWIEKVADSLRRFEEQVKSDAYPDGGRNAMLAELDTMWKDVNHLPKRKKRVHP